MRASFSEGGEAGMGAEETYHRIMRKLQRQANYEAAATTNIGSTGSTTPGVGSTTTGNSNVTGGKALELINNSGAPAPSSSSPRGIHGTTSPQQPDLNPSSHSLATKDIDLGEETEEERRFGETPVPGSLRLLLENLQVTLTEKLTMGGISSLKECMRHVFECRGLLDKLMKEIPSHGNFVEAKGTNHLQEWFQEFRKIPIMLPLSTYKPQEGTGRYVPEITNRTGTNSSVAPSGIGGGDPMGRSTLGRSGRKQVAPPSSTGGASTARSGRRPSYESSNSSKAGTAISGGGSLRHHPHPQHHHPPHHLPHAVSPTASSVGTSIFSHQSPIHSKDHMLLMKHLRRQTQVIDGSCQTEETIAKMVPKEECQALQAKISRLERIINEYEDLVEKLNTQLDTARGAIAHRSKTVKYLRETLHKECCILRQNLSVAQSRQQQMVTAAKSSSKFEGGAGGGGGLERKSSMVTSNTFEPQTPGLSGNDSLNISTGGFGRTVGGNTNQDITSVHSLLDLVLLAVEKDKQIDDDGKLVTNPREEVSKLKEEIRDKQIKYRQEQTALRMKFSLLMGEKNKQLQAMKISTDTVRMRTAVTSIIAQLREEFQAMRFSVKEVLSLMSTSIFNITNELDFVVKTANAELMDLRQIKQQQLVVSDAIKSSEQLFLPMMRPEFALGCHMWEHTRQPEPVRSYITQRYGPDIVHRISPELYSLQHLYTNLQRFVLQMFQKPDPQKPVFGLTLERLAHMMLAADDCLSEQAMSIRAHMTRDTKYALDIARLNFTLKRYTMKQHILQDRSKNALIEAGMDPNTLTLPVQGTINHLGFKVSRLRADKNAALLQRQENARQLWQLWKESNLDIYRGRTQVITKDPATMWSPSVPKHTRLAGNNRGKKGAQNRTPLGAALPHPGRPSSRPNSTRNSPTVSRPGSSRPPLSRGSDGSRGSSPLNPSVPPLPQLPVTSTIAGSANSNAPSLPADGSFSTTAPPVPKQPSPE